MRSLAPDLGNTMRERWRYYLKRRRDEEGNARDDLLTAGTLELRRMPIVTADDVSAPGVAPAAAIFAGVTWQGIGPQPLRIDKEQNFQGSGPASGEVVDILIDSAGAADATMYIAVNNGGVWKSTNGGASWEPKCDFMPSLSMGALAMDPVDHDVIYAGTGNNFDGGIQFIRGHGIYRSVDAGETWTVLADALLANRHVVRMAIPAPDLLLVATDAGLFRSIDGGRHFGANAPSFDDGNAVLAGVVTDLLLEHGNPSTVYACVQGVGVMRSTDIGVSFPTNLFSTPGAPSAPFDWITLAQSEQPDNQVLYALVTDATATPQFKGLFRSPDRGASWTLMPGAATPAADNNGLQNGYDVTVAVDPLDPNRVYIGFQELYLSGDGGQNFGSPAISANHVHFDHHVTAFTPHRPATAPTPFYVGTDGGIARNDDGNTAWTNLNETISTNLLLGMDIGRNSVAANQFTCAGAQDTGTSQRKPSFAGRDWHLGVDGDGTRVVVDPNNAQRVYARDNESLIVTSDGGTNWSFPTAAATGLPAVSGGTDADAKPMGVDPTSSAIVYVAHDAQLFRSADTGATFTLMNAFPGNVSALATTKQDPKILVVGCEDGSVHRTTNADAGAGATFTALTVNGAPALIVSGAAIDPTDVKAVAVTYSGFTTINAVDRTKHVFFSADATSTPLEDVSGTDGAGPDTNVPDLPVHTVVIDPATTPHSIIIGCDVDVLRTTDGGATWHIYGAGLPNADCTSLAMDPSVSPPLLRVGTYGRGAFELVRPATPQLVVLANLAFGDVAVGATSDLTFDLFNVGGASLDVNSIVDASGEPSFSLQGAPATPFAIAPGAQVTLTMRFAPATAGKHVTSYSIGSTDPTRPTVAVHASGLTAASGPQVTGVVPASGPAAGGTNVKVLGSALTGATAVAFGAAAGTAITVDSDTQVSVVSPPGAGVVDVTVTVPAGTTPANPAAQFTYLGAGTVVTGVNPPEGPETGGTSVTISGSGFASATQVLFGAFAATGMTVDTDAQITAVTPAGSGTVDVLVATPTGTSPPSGAARFRYTTPGGGVAGGDGGGTGATGGAGTGTGTGENLVLSALADILRTGTDPDVLEAQRTLLRRIALEGNVIDSRVPPPKNITEIGGYINLLTLLSHIDIRTQMLASTLGVAGPATPIGLSGEGPVLAFVSLVNDRPDVPAQPSLTPAVTVRGDMADAFAAVQQRIRGLGCALPLFTPPRVLPVAQPGRPVDADVLELLGRVLRVAPTALLADPAVDPVAIARLASDPPDRWQLVVREVDGDTKVIEASWVAYQAGGGDVTITPPAPRRYVPVGPLLADAGWYSAQPLVLPTSSVDQGSLPRLVNVTGLVPGETLLGDELALLYSRAAIAASALAGRSSWVWNGTAFVPPAADSG